MDFFRVQVSRFRVPLYWRSPEITPQFGRELGFPTPPRPHPIVHGQSALHGRDSVTSISRGTCRAGRRSENTAPLAVPPEQTGIGIGLNFAKKGALRLDSDLPQRVNSYDFVVGFVKCVAFFKGFEELTRMTRVLGLAEFLEQDVFRHSVPDNLSRPI